jgi:poly [ADP-ribose] polymerase 2/3/4
MATIIREEKYIKSDVNNNNNKWWTAQLYDNGDVITLWGRVGDKGQSKTFPSAGVSFLEKKCREKESARNDEIPYRKLNVINSSGIATTTNKTVTKVADSAIKDIAKKQIKTNNPLVTKLIEYLTMVNVHAITEATQGKITYNDTTGLFSTPLGIVTQSNIDEANRILVQISNLVASRDYGRNIGELTNSYMMLIPMNIGHKKVDVNDLWSNVNKIQYQKGILDSLQSSLDAASSVSLTDTKAKSVAEKRYFDVELNTVSNPSVIDRIHRLYHTTKKNHSCSYLKPADVYEIKIGKMFDEWNNDGAKLSNIWELWHGSSCSNLISIFSKGFMIPPRTSSNVTGRMFSDGVYASNISTKALGYSTGYWGKSSNNRYFMFLLDMAMGKYFVPPGPSDSLPKQGYDSTFAKPGHSGIQNEEMIVYRTSQCNPKYLVEFK